jgi:hypothetical protein
MLISCASTRRKQTSLQGTPVDSLDSSLVLSKDGTWFAWVVVSNIPDHKLVIVSTRGKHFVVVRTPSEAADFLFMALKHELGVA